MIAHLLPWDSAHFGYTIAQADIETFTLELQDWCRGNKVDCLYFLAQPGDDSTVLDLEDAGAHLTDMRIVLGCNLNYPPLPIHLPNRNISISPAQGDDLVQLGESIKFPYSRFYYDVHFRRGDVNQMFRLWIENSYIADETLVARVDSKPVGLITCKVREPSMTAPTLTGDIVLVGVDPTCQSIGVATDLGYQALAWLKDHDCDEVYVVTQGRNIAAQRLYQRLGFMTEQIKLYYHVWI